jgi:ABC-type nitrate/sulfonate/bicarbonate transport system substrate-binding protein
MPVKFALGNMRSIQYYPFYVAQAAGLFKDEGLEVDLQVVSGGGAETQQLIAGNLDIINVAAGPPIQAVAVGQDLVYFYTYFQQNIFTIAAPTANGATKLEDIKGGVVGISDASGGEVPFVRGAFSSVGLTDGKDYQMLPIGEGGQVTFEALRTGKAQAYSSSVFDVASITTFGMPLNIIAPDDFIFVPSIGLTVTRKTFTENPQMLTCFGRAVAKAMVWSAANTDAAKAICEKAEPELFDDAKLAEAIWDTTQRLLTAPKSGVDTSLYGAHYLEGWKHYIEVASQASVEEGGLPGPVDITKMVDATLLPAINDFDKAAVEAAAKAYVVQP